MARTVINNGDTGLAVRNAINGMTAELYAKLGTTTNDNAALGEVGEYVQGEVLVGAAVALTTATAKTIVSISLTAGDWDVTGHVMAVFGATTSFTQLWGSLSTTNDTLDILPGKSAVKNTPAVVPGTVYETVSIPAARFSLAVTTTIYLVIRGTFTVSTMSGFGRLSARRVR